MVIIVTKISSTSGIKPTTSCFLGLRMSHPSTYVTTCISILIINAFGSRKGWYYIKLKLLVYNMCIIAQRENLVLWGIAPVVGHCLHHWWKTTHNWYGQHGKSRIILGNQGVSKKYFVRHALCVLCFNSMCSFATFFHWSCHIHQFLF